MRERVCITGLSGRLGSILAADLAPDFELVALNRRPLAGVESVRADPHGPAKMCSHADFTAGVRRALELSRRPGYHLLTLISDDQPA